MWSANFSKPISYESRIDSYAGNCKACYENPTTIFLIYDDLFSLILVLQN